MTAPPRMWHPVALVSGVEPGTSNGTRLFGQEIVVWRDTDGASHVWEDRCPHRGMRLSFGFVRGGQLACLYHGWRYDAAGQCRYIPAHPQLTPPGTIKVAACESAERLGMIWVRNGGTPEGEPPEDRIVTEVRSITVECAPARARSFLLGAALPHDAVARVASLAPDPVSVSMDGLDVLIGVQPLSAAACALHIVIAGAADRAARKRVGAWAEDLRRDLERAAPQPAGVTG